MKIEMTGEERAFFADLGIDPSSDASVLSIVLASPAAVAQNLGVERTVRLAVKLTTNLPFGSQMALIGDFEDLAPPATGALDPKDAP